MKNFYTQIAQLDERITWIVVTVIQHSNNGQRAIWGNGDFLYQQSEEAIFDKLRPLLTNLEKTQIITLDEALIFCEFIVRKNHIVICGAGHISIPIIKIAKMIDFDVTVIDDRLSFVNDAQNAGADNVVCQSFSEALDSINASENHYFVIVTRGHRYDQDCLFKIIKMKNAYIGMIGSKMRVRMVMESLQERGIGKGLLEKVYSPIGLKIGSQTPEEIAVSIIAEIIQVKSQNKSGYGYPNNILEVILSYKTKDVPKALVTIVSRKGSAPRDVGTKMLVLLDGTCVGTIGGGCVESEICNIARDCAREMKSVLQTVNLTSENAEDEGMVCGGIIQVYIEPIYLE